MNKKHQRAANFIGQAAASARQAIEQANDRARYQTAMQAAAWYNATYTAAFADILAQAICNTAAVTGLVVPALSYQLLPDTFPVNVEPEMETWEPEPISIAPPPISQLSMTWDDPSLPICAVLPSKVLSLTVR